MTKEQGVFEATYRALYSIQSEFTEHCAKVSFLMKKFNEVAQCFDEKQLVKYVILAFFHDIGAFKTELFSRLAQFEVEHVMKHCEFGYLFIKYLTPFSKDADVVRYHHANFLDYNKTKKVQIKIGILLHLLDRYAILMEAKEPNAYEMIESGSGSKFNPKDVQILFKAEEKFHLARSLENGTYLKEMEVFFQNLNQLHFSAQAFIQIAVYAIDFRSPQTVTHTMKTTRIAVELAKIFQLSQQQISDIYYGALLHDVGKIKTPIEILEKTAALTSEEFEIMKLHVKETYAIIHDIFEDSIVQIACRHHEKLDGSGYPFGLKAEDLTLSQRIVIVADILSALSLHRSYRKRLTKKKVFLILQRMAYEQKIDSRVVKITIEHYDEINQICQKEARKLVKKYTDMSNRFKKLNIAEEMRIL